MQRLYARLHQWWSHRSRPAPGKVRFGHLRRLKPIDRDFGYRRGTPIDRYYIERFLSAHSQDIRGRVLEVGDNSYTRRFGGHNVQTSDILHVVEGNPQATIIADLTDAAHIPSNSFDCMVLTQTLHLIFDVSAAIRTLHRILKPGGVLLATFPGISQISRDEWRETWYWAFTSLSARRLFEEHFSSSKLDIQAYGNVLTATAFLQGLAVSELRQEELDYHDPQYQLLISVAARKEDIGS